MTINARDSVIRLMRTAALAANFLRCVGMTERQALDEVRDIIDMADELAAIAKMKRKEYRHIIKANDDELREFAKDVFGEIFQQQDAQLKAWGEKLSRPQPPVH